MNGKAIIKSIKSMKHMKYQFPDGHLATYQKLHHFFNFLIRYEFNCICNEQNYHIGLDRLDRLHP